MQAKVSNQLGRFWSLTKKLGRQRSGSLVANHKTRRCRHTPIDGKKSIIIQPQGSDLGCTPLSLKVDLPPRLTTAKKRKY
jgi:hypothetical protein